MKSIGAEFFTTGCPTWRQPHAYDAVLKILLIYTFIINSRVVNLQILRFQ